MVWFYGGRWPLFSLFSAVGLVAVSLVASLSPDPVRAAEPAEKARLAFVNGSRIFAIDADGSNRQALTFRAKSLGEYDEEFDRAPRVSPDGIRVLFLREVDYDRGGEFTKLMVAPMTGGRARTVTTSDRLAPKKRRFVSDVELESAAWSQDGTRIIFSQTNSRYWLYRAEWLSRIRSIKQDGSGLKTVMTSRLKRSRAKGYVGPGLYGDIDISSGDGRVLVTRERVPGGRADIIAFDGGPGKFKRLVRSAKEARWSPDGTAILFLSDRDRTGRQCYEGGCDFQVKLYTAKSDGSAQRRVQKQPQSGTIFGADWSPDGSRIAFGSDRNIPGMLGMSVEIYSVRPDGSCLTWLTNGSPESWDPNWSPGGGFDSDPGACGATDRDVMVDPLPSAQPLVNNRPTTWPRLWPGPVFKTAVLTFPDAEGDNLAYYDCALFKRSECSKVFAELSSRGICQQGFSDLLEAGRYRGMIEHRGALLTKPFLSSDGNRGVTLITGGQIINILLDDFPFRTPTTLAEYLELVGTLRPVGRDDLIGADLQGAVFDRGDVEKARGITRAFDRIQSVPKVAKRFRTKPRTVRAYLRFQCDSETLGTVKSVRCPD